MKKGQTCVSACTPYTAAEDALIRSGASFQQFEEAFPGKRTRHAWRQRRSVLGVSNGRDGLPEQVARADEVLHQLTPHPQAAQVQWDKKNGRLNWRDVADQVTELQGLRQRASKSQTHARIQIESDEPIILLPLSDLHLASWGTDHQWLVEQTDLMMSIPNLYIGLVGDLIEMAIKLRGVAEVSGNMLPPDLQHDLLESWIEEITPKLLFATWDNHAVEREEQQAGSSYTARMLRERVVYHGGIGHTDLIVGPPAGAEAPFRGVTYPLAISHRFRGNSYINPTHGIMRYLVQTAPSRRIGIAGDSHQPGLTVYWHGEQEKVALNAGSIHANSAYAQRYYSLTTIGAYPCLVLDPHQYRVTPYTTLDHCLASSHWASFG